MTTTIHTSASLRILFRAERRRRVRAILWEALFFSLFTTLAAHLFFTATTWLSFYLSGMATTVAAAILTFLLDDLAGLNTYIRSHSHPPKE